jgi:hypothetical protein
MNDRCTFSEVETKSREQEEPSQSNDEATPRGPRDQLPLKRPSSDELLILLKNTPIKSLREWCISLSLAPCGNHREKLSYSVPLINCFWKKYNDYDSLSSSSLLKIARLVPLPSTSGYPTSRKGLIYFLLQRDFSDQLLRKVVNVKALNKTTVQRVKRGAAADLDTSNELAADEVIISSWPQPIDSSRILSCCKSYLDATTIRVPSPCVCCGRSFLTSNLSTAFQFSFDEKSLPVNHVLRLLTSPLPQPDFLPLSSVSTILHDILLHHRYVGVDTENRQISVTLCNECQSSLNAARIPKFSLCNNLVRGDLPPDLQDITWIEEKVCALHRVTADVARLQYAESDDKLPYRLVGNTCAYPVNVPSVARVLPRLPSDINENLTVVFVGAKFDKKQLPPMFRVRRCVIERFLSFLATNNPLYSHVEISIEHLNLYPEDDVLPSLSDSVILNHSVDPAGVLAAESAAFEDHPANMSSEPDSDRNVVVHHQCEDVESDAVIESTGVIDFKGATISGHSTTASALFNLLQPRKPNDQPDLIIPRGTGYVNDYDNPHLFPGMFPTLFPFGTGGIEAERPIPISFQEHANYLLSLHDPLFKHHRFFLFVALSIIKK